MTSNTQYVGSHTPNPPQYSDYQELSGTLLEEHDD